MHQERRWRRRRFLYRRRRTHHRKKEIQLWSEIESSAPDTHSSSIRARATRSAPREALGSSSIGLCFFLQLQDTRPYLVERLVGSVIEQRIITAGQGRSQLRPVLGL